MSASGAMIESALKNAGYAAASAARSTMSETKSVQDNKRAEIRALVTEITDAIAKGSYTASSHAGLLTRLTKAYKDTFDEEKRRTNKSLYGYATTAALAFMWYGTAYASGGAAFLWYLVDDAVFNDGLGDKDEIRYNRESLHNAMVAAFKWAAKSEGVKVTQDKAVLDMVVAVSPHEPRSIDSDELYPDNFRDRKAHAEFSELYKNILRQRQHLILKPQAGFFDSKEDEKIVVKDPLPLVKKGFSDRVQGDFMRLIYGCRRGAQQFMPTDEVVVADQKAAPAKK